jgi:flagellar hook-basal body complex protein FliE
MSSNLNVEHVLAQIRLMTAEARGRGEPAGTEGGSFGEMLKRSIDQVNATQQNAREMATRLDTGAGEASLAEVMVALQKSSLSFQAMVQVRNKLVEAYKDVMNMPI